MIISITLEVVRADYGSLTSSLSGLVPEVMASYATFRSIINLVVSTDDLYLYKDAVELIRVPRHAVGRWKSA
jgi:hypothetical protein